MWEKPDSYKIHTQSVKQHFSYVRQYENQHPIKSKQVFVRIYENWGQLCKLAQKLHSNIADIVSEEYNVPYPVVQDWVQSVSIMKATGV